jgi:hypothetical protein
MRLTKKEKQHIKDTIVKRFQNCLAFNKNVMDYIALDDAREKIVREDAFANPTVKPILDFLKTIYKPEIIESVIHTEYAPCGLLNRFRFSYGSLQIHFTFDVMPENADKLHQLNIIKDNTRKFYKEFNDLIDNLDDCYEKAESKTYPSSMTREEIIELIIESMWKSLMKKSDYILKEA